ncbi:uncharacterized protein LOC143220626 [Lasioglossum baleicum]|uniref:uncharacterized protein LOC143220626 n=1 Tax=Lasioglossum baleicum TaxID=434251 RepID=UPI003FCD9EDA
MDDRQFGFRQGRSIIEMLLTVKSLSERVIRLGGFMLAFGLVIANAFNGMPWTAIRSALVRHRVPDYLTAMNRDYLSAAFDEVLHAALPAGVSVRCHADDTLGAASGMNNKEMALRAEELVVAVVGAIEHQGFRVSPEKTQAIWFHSGRKVRVIPHARGKIGGKVKYLVLVLDGRWTFEDHFEERAPVCRGRIPHHHARGGRRSGGPPTDGPVGGSCSADQRAPAPLPRREPGPGSEELVEMEEKKREIRRSAMNRRQCRLRRPDSARHRAVGPIVLVLDDWMWSRSKRTLCITQVLSGHGCFGEHLHMIRKEVTPECWHYGAEVDSAQHTLVDCSAWMPVRRELQRLVGWDPAWLHGLHNFVYELQYRGPNQLRPLPPSLRVAQHGQQGIKQLENDTNLYIFIPFIQYHTSQEPNTLYQEYDFVINEANCNTL